MLNTTVKTIFWWIFALLCIMIGLYPSIYFMIDRTFGLLSSKSPELLNNLLWNIGFYGHIIPGGLALLVGWIQFSKKIRNNKPLLHRRIGKLYVISVMIGGICGVFIGFNATGGPVAAAGFIALGIIWLGSTWKAYAAARNKQFESHETWMVYSYAACFAAVTLRLWLPLLVGFMGEFEPAYRIVAWLCWVPNLAVAYWINYTRKKQLHLLVHA